MARESFEIYFNFLSRYSDTVQSIISYAGLNYYKEKDSPIQTFKDEVEYCYEQRLYHFPFFNSVRYRPPLDKSIYPQLILSFAAFYPVYDSLIRLSVGQDEIFLDLVNRFNVWHGENIDEYIFRMDCDKPRFESPKYVIEKKIHDRVIVVRPGIRWQVFERDDFRCVACGMSPRDSKDVILHVDHIVPRSKGGLGTIDNFQTLCQICNIGKSNKSNKNLRKKGLE